jgi:hypothetical protein
MKSAVSLIVFCCFIFAAGCWKAAHKGEFRTLAAIERTDEQSEALVKEFKRWLEKDLLPNMTAATLIATSHDTIYWHLGGDTYVYGESEPDDFIPDYFEFMKRDWTNIFKPDCKYCSIYENTGSTDFREYPVITLSLYIEDGEQTRYNFIRVQEGFKLVQAIIRDHDAVVIYSKKDIVEPSSDTGEPRVKRIYYTLGSGHKLAAANIRHCVDLENLNVHVETENYKDGDTVSITVSIPADNDFACLSMFDGALKIDLNGIVFENKAVFEKCLEQYIKR